MKRFIIIALLLWAGTAGAEEIKKPAAIDIYIDEMACFLDLSVRSLTCTSHPGKEGKVRLIFSPEIAEIIQNYPAIHEMQKKEK